FFIFTSEESMLEINKKFLDHNYHTDVISFDYSAEDKVRGEIYLGLETIRRNSVIYGSGIKEELVRVMIHGTLHLCGYRDEKKKDRERMLDRQEEKLKEFMELIK
ncbi:MAG: rRNA maturation RNase YbeY, partial [Bacteroidia bacterium]